ncbi:T9SS type A sorting domain-containing protein [Dyadobacter sp. LHD-138]|uniref:T9SS type A sorting domain-containing protein n=1 Tax=Dyadobacter sp. LHD-138 TaxID=3071413 RepID=UPI0027DEDC9C|nr:T9SS type A sorting domain-containing protein [Dyadobacter sp. LHD-138]MDQ6480669.1 T9SS type A sorting domain-containing protein [Dyadobacter sp. LHD-138]
MKFTSFQQRNLPLPGKSFVKSCAKRRKNLNQCFIATLGIFTFLFALLPGNAFGQCGFQTGEGCPGTDYNNYGFASTNNFQTLEYDNYISAFHSTLVRTYDGSFLVWGEGVASTGLQTVAGALIVPTAVTPANGFNYGANNKILKAALGSGTVNRVQAIILTQNGLYTWGYEGGVIDAGLTSNSAFQAIASGAGNNSIVNGNQWDLPGTIQPQQVKMLFATKATLALVTCDGQAWVLSQNATIRHGGTDARSWVRVSTASGTPLNNVVALRGVDRAMIALTYDTNTQTQELYTWGQATRTGTGGASDRNYASLMVKPGTGNIKMIGATQAVGATSSILNITYYILYTNGTLYSLGDNVHRQLGIFSTTNSNSWVQPTYTSGGAIMNNIKWISPSEHDGAGWAAVNVINNTGEIWNWGTDIGVMLGRSSTATSDEHDGTSDPAGKAVNPGRPADAMGVGGPYTSVETGGHTTMATRQCVSNFGYVGHAIRGSAGDKTSTEAFYRTFSYNTEGVQVCGATTAAVVTIEGGITATGNSYCGNMQPITLVGSPANGTFSFVGTPPAGVTLNPTTGMLNLNGATGKIKVSYQTTSGAPCNVALSTDIEFDIVACTYKKVSGAVWNDTDKDARLDAGESGLNPGSQLWANLIWIDAANGDKIVSSVKVNADGTYELPATFGPGNYRVEITNKSFGANTPASSINNATDRTLPGTWTYTGTNVNNGNVCTPPCSTPYTLTGITVASTDVAGYNFGIQLPPVTISGNVWHDTDGDAVKNGSEKPVSGKNADDNGGNSSVTGSNKWVNLVNAEGKVVQSVQLNKDGSYNFQGVTPNVSYKVILTTAQQTSGTDLTEASQIPGWKATGTNTKVAGTPTANPGNKTNVIDLGQVTAHVENANFAIQQQPEATSATYGLTSKPLSGDLILLNGSVGASSGSGTKVAPLVGTDPDGTDATPFFFVITSLPVTNGGTATGDAPVLFYNGIPVTQNDIINKTKFADPSLFSVGLNGKGYTRVSFGFKTVDAAGAESAPASYTLSWDSPLPVTLISFTAQAEAHGIVGLIWKTSQESNADRFLIERSSNAKIWNQIADKAAIGESNALAIYTANDENPLSGLNYYRLKMVDIDGTYSYSRVVSVKLTGNSPAVTAYPNPVTNILYLKDIAPESVRLISLTDSYGREIYRSSGVPERGIDITTFADGIYLIKTTMKDGSMTVKKIVINK